MKYLFMTILTLAAIESLAKSINCWDRNSPFGERSNIKINLTNVGLSNSTISLTFDQRTWHQSFITKVERVPVVHQSFRTDYHFKSGSLVISPKQALPMTEAYFAYLIIKPPVRNPELTYLLYCDYLR